MILLATIQEQKGQEQIVPVSTLVTEDSIVEEVIFEKRPSLQIHYLNQKKKDQILDEIVTKDHFGNMLKYIPIDNEHVKKGSVIFPEANLDIEEATFSQLWELQEKLLDLGFDSVKQRQEASLIQRICTSTWFLDKEESNIAGMGKFAPIIPIRGLSGGGKNRFLNISRWSCYHPFYQLSTNKIPSIYRPLELYKGVLCLDECDLDAQRDKELIAFLLSRSYGNPISRQNPNNVNESNAFNQFQLSILTQRENFGENALEGRSIPFYAEKSWQKLPTLETAEMEEVGKQIQKLSLALRLKYWQKIEIKKDYWLNTSDARLNSALLPLVAISELDSSIMILLNSLLRRIERRKTVLKAQSDDGVIVNYLYEKIYEKLFRSYNNGQAFYFLDKIGERETEQSREVKDSKESVEIPLTTSQMRFDLNWKSATAIRKKLDSLLHLEDLPEQTRIKDKVCKPVFFKAEPLIKILREFVVDFDEEKLPSELKPKTETLDSQM